VPPRWAKTRRNQVANSRRNQVAKTRRNRVAKSTGIRIRVKRTWLSRTVTGVVRENDRTTHLVGPDFTVTTAQAATDIDRGEGLYLVKVDGHLRRIEVARGHEPFVALPGGDSAPLQVEEIAGADTGASPRGPGTRQRSIR